VDYMTSAEVAKHYRVSQDTVRRWVRDGRLPCVNIGTDRRPTYRIPTAAIKEVTRWQVRDHPKPEREWV
jgi:excisionase family DNA binding protein